MDIPEFLEILKKAGVPMTNENAAQLYEQLSSNSIKNVLVRKGLVSEKELDIEFRQLVSSLIVQLGSGMAKNV